MIEFPNFWVKSFDNFWKNLALTEKSWRKVNKTHFNPLCWVFPCALNSLNWVGFYTSNPPTKIMVCITKTCILSITGYENYHSSLHLFCNFNQKCVSSIFSFGVYNKAQKIVSSKTITS